MTLRSKLTLTVVLLFSVVFMCGCPNPNTYGVPRTVEPGKVMHSLAPEAQGFSGKTVATAANPNGTTYSLTYPTFPTYTLRVGVADQVDLGFRLSNFSSLGVDVKFNFLKTPGFDMAVNPAVQGAYYSFGDTSNNGTSASATIVWFHIPLMIGINFSKTVTLVLLPGATYLLTTASASTGDNSAARTNGGLYARMGVGVDIRVGKKFALHPEFTVLRNFKDDYTLWYMAGFGLNFGAIPNYDDVGD